MSEYAEMRALSVIEAEAETIMRSSARFLSIPLGMTLVFGCSQLPRIALAAEPPAKARHQTSSAPPPPSSPAPGATTITDIVNDPQFQKELQGKTPAQVEAWAAQLSAKGLKRLPYDDLVAWNTLRTQMAANSPVVCAGFWKGGIGGSQIQKVLTMLGKADTDRWTALSMRAVALEVKNVPYPAISPDYRAQLAKLVMSGLEEGAQTRFQMLAAKGANITDEDACWLMKALLEKAGSKNIDQITRERALRALAALGSPQ